MTTATSSIFYNNGSADVGAVQSRVRNIEIGSDILLGRVGAYDTEDNVLAVSDRLCRDGFAQHVFFSYWYIVDMLAERSSCKEPSVRALTQHSTSMH